MVDELRSEDSIVSEVTQETPELPVAQSETEVTMEEMMQQYDVMGDFHRGKVVEGTIVDVSEEGWLVDVGYKCEGFLPRREWTHKVLVEDVMEPENGSKVTVQITNIGQGEDAQLGLSRWRCEFDARWNKMEEELEKNETIDVVAIRKVKGGLIVNAFGLEGFIPISHLAEEGRGVNPGRLLDQSFPVKLLEKDRRKRRLVFSRRSLIEAEMSGLRETFYEQVNVGDTLEGDVSSITSFGVFVNLGAMEGLVHITELSWQRNAKAKDIVTKGDHVKVKVIGIDKDSNRISLSIRQTLSDPWDSVGECWKPGMVTEGVVTNLTEFGAFVEIEPGIEGLIHIGDLSWTRIKHPKEVLRKGQKIEVSVIEVDTERKRISLGYKQLNDPWKDIDTRYVKNQEIPVKVVRIADFGAFVEIEEGIEGLIHISQLSTKRVENPREVLSEGQEVTARVLEVNPAERRIRLSLRPINEEPMKRSQSEEGKEEGHDDRQRRRKPSGRKESDRQANHLPKEEANVTIGDFLMHAKSEAEDSAE